MATPTAANYWVMAAIAAAAAVWALVRFVASIRRDRTVQDTPLVRIRSAAQGYVKVYGHARAAPEGLQVAPLSSRQCVWWSFDVAERRRASNNRTEWASVERASSVTPFVLEDDDGQCLVGPINAEITATVQSTWYGAEQRPAGGPPIESVLFDSSNYRYTERLLVAGYRLSVVGELRSNSEIHREDEAVAKILHDWKQDQHALLARFDANHDGRIDATEWEAVRSAAAEEAKSQMLTTPINRVSVIGEPVNGQPFIIAPMDSEHLVQREKRRAMVYLLLGVVFVVVSGYAVRHALELAAATTR